MDWELATFQPDFLKLFWGYFRTPETQRNHHEIGQTLDRCIADFTRLDSHLSKSAFLAGPRFSMGDIPIGTSLYRWFRMGLPVPELSHVRSWYERLALRPAFQRTVMVSFEELRGRLEY
jgi:glutathione S-transferase